MDRGPPGSSSLHGIFQARTLEGVAILFSSRSSQPKIWVSYTAGKILQARLQQYVNCELPDVQAGFRKGRGTRDQIANIHWVIEKAREFQKNIYFCFLTMPKPFMAESEEEQKSLLMKVKEESEKVGLKLNI